MTLPTSYIPSQCTCNTKDHTLGHALEDHKHGRWPLRLVWAGPQTDRVVAQWISHQSPTSVDLGSNPSAGKDFPTIVQGGGPVAKSSVSHIVDLGSIPSAGKDFPNIVQDKTFQHPCISGARVGVVGCTLAFAPREREFASRCRRFTDQASGRGSAEGRPENAFRTDRSFNCLPNCRRQFGI
ncbi:uncharacterized protein LOC144212950 isoform X2 [Stigmatopora nigra]